MLEAAHVLEHLARDLVEVARHERPMPQQTAVMLMRCMMGYVVSRSTVEGIEPSETLQVAIRDEVDLWFVGDNPEIGSPQ